VALPTVVKLLILHQFSSAQIVGLAASLAIICAPYLLISNTKFRKLYWVLISFLMIAWSGTETLYLLQEKAEFGTAALKIFLESNPRELKEYALEIIPKAALIAMIGAFLGMIYFVLCFIHDDLVLNTRLRSIFVSAAILGLGFLLIQKQTAARYGILANQYRAVRDLTIHYKQINKSATQIATQIAQLRPRHQRGRKTYVLIIGESTSRHHMSIYDYWRPTTPLLQTRTDLQIYSDVLSSNSSTVECLSKCLTVDVNQDTLHNFADATIVDIANSCGIKTFWLSNQDKGGIAHNSITESLASANTIAYMEEKYISTAPRTDELLIQDLQIALQDTSAEKLIVLHLMGTHFRFKDRLPNNYGGFCSIDSVQRMNPNANTVSKAQQVNDYDNANLHQDYFLNTVLNILDQERLAHKEVSAIYFSDHGEEVYDTRNFIGHTPLSNTSWLHEIPFFTWGIADSVNRYKPYQMQHFAHSLCDWMSIFNNKYDSCKSIFSAALNVGERKLGNSASYIATRTSWGDKK
jgi:heptose-I-phosphate ethanolaminephosphotransferase